MRTFSILIIGFCALAVSACTPTFRNHGYIPNQEDLQELQVGVDTRETVETAVGTPTAGGVLEGGNYFYVRSTVRTFGPRRPKVVDRQVLAVSFDQSGVLSNIESFGLQDGRVVVLTRRVTDGDVNNINFLRQLLGNIGRVGPDFGSG